MTLSWKWIALLSLLIHASLIVWLPYTPPERASAVMMVLDLAPVPAPSERTSVQQSAVQPAPQAVKPPSQEPAPLPRLQPAPLVSKQAEPPDPAMQQKPASASAPLETVPAAPTEAATERLAAVRNPAALAGPHSAATSKAAEDGNSGPALLRHPAPDIPRKLRQQKASGTVRLRIVLAASGEVREVEIMQSSGYDAFDQVARKQVLHEWTFRPARRDGVAVESELILPLRMQVIDEPMP